MACKYYINGVESQLYTELYGYMDNTAPEKKSVENVYKILKNNGIATRHKGSTYLNQANLEPSLREISRINTKYPGLLATSFIKTTPKTIYSPESELHSLDINPAVLENIQQEGPETADFTYEDQTELDQYVRLVAGNEKTDDYYLSEKARQENTSDQSRFSDMAKEDQDRLESKVVSLKEAFSKVGITVDVEYDTELENLGEVRPGEVNPIVVLNPNLVKEDTAYHEFGHIYIDMLGINDPVVAQAIAQLKGTPLYKQVQETYPELTGERLDKEVLATAIGLEGAKIVRKNPNWLQRLLNKIFRRVGKIFGIQPEAAAILAEEMFAKKLRGEKMLNPLSPYTQESRDHQNFTEIVQDLKVRIASEIYQVEQLPAEEREKRIYNLQGLKQSLDKVKSVEDLLDTVNAMASSLSSAISEYDRIMQLPINERATLENMSSIYKLKTELDALDVMQSIKRVMLVKQNEGKVLDEGNFDKLEARVNSILNTALVYDKKFNDEIIPIMAQFLSGYHNKAIDPQLQAQIDNARRYKRTQGLNTKTIEYVELKKQYKNGELTDVAFLDAQVELKIEQLKNKMIPNYGALVKQLRAAHKDKSAFSYMLDPLIYSNDNAIQLFVKSVQNADVKKNDMTRIFKSKLSPQYNEFIAGMSESDVAKLNEDLLEDVTVNGIKRLGIVNPIDTEKYYAARREGILKIKATYGVPVIKDNQSNESFIEEYKTWIKTNQIAYKKARAAEAQWDKKNSKPIEGWRDELKVLNTQIAQAKALRKKLKEEGKEDSDAYSMQTGRLQELEKFKRRNYNTETGTPIGDWVSPDPKVYLNPKYTKIQNNPRLKKYYDFVLEELQVGHRMIGPKMDKNSWDKFSYLMPSIRKKDYDRLREQGIIAGTRDMLKESFSLVETDDQYGTYDQNTGELNKSVPVYYTNKVNARDVSRDIAGSLYQFRHMAHNYKAKSEAVGSVMLFRDIIKNRKVLEENSSGIEYIQKTAESMGFKMPLLKEGESNTFKHIDEWVDMVMFGQNELKSEWRGISLTKAVGSLNAFTAMSTLSFNLLQGTNQLILDNATMVQEAVAGQFMSKSDLAWAKTQYWFNERAAISDIGRFNPESKLGKALEYFDALTEFTDQEGNTIVGGKARKLIEGGNLLFLQQAAEHELSSTRLLALMHTLKGKLKDSDGKVLKNEKGEEADLYDMLVIDKKTGVMSVDSRVDNFNRLDFIGLVQGLSRRTNQTKGKIHSPMIARRAYGKLLMLFRSWLLPGIRRRYGHGGGSTLRVDEELGTVTQGMYISFWNMLRESVANKEFIYTTYKKMSEMEQQNAKRTGTELAAMVAAAALVAALANLDDDEESWASNFILYQAKRYHMEVTQWNPLGLGGETFRMMRSPTATARPVEKGIDLLQQLGNELGYITGMPWIDEGDVFYQRRTGRFNKGDRKIRKDFEDLLPIWRGVTRSNSPEEAYKWFTSVK
tara:strand:- start:12486 stop:16859 length:4374 start_codon:yes stop_codon:yes gene_type:complete